MAKTIFHPADQRGHADHGWLNAHHSFSFASYHNPEKVHFGMLRVLNDDIVAGGEGFGTHPHDNMEIITIMLSGELAHKDSMGHIETIVPGEVQVMSAGTGLRHSEYNHLADAPTNLLQSWIFPDKRNVTPRYDQRSFPVEDRTNRLQMIVSPIYNEDEGLKIHQYAWIYRSELQGGHTVEVAPHRPNNGFYIFVISGSITANGQALNTKDALGISEIDNLTITAAANTDFLVYEVPMTVG